MFAPPGQILQSRGKSILWQNERSNPVSSWLHVRAIFPPPDWLSTLRPPVATHCVRRTTKGGMSRCTALASA